MNWQAVFFDFDGVVLDSVRVKTEAFAKMFRQYGPDIESKVVAYHLANGGVSRFNKFRYFYENLLKQEITEEKLRQLGEEFSGHVLNRVLKAPFMEGALDTLIQLKARNIVAYIVSGTPHEEINYIVEQKGISHFFREVYGTPKEKFEIIRDILFYNGYQNTKCLFIGDAMSDYKAAQENGVYFFGVVKKGDVSPFPRNTLFSSTVTADIIQSV